MDHQDYYTTLGVERTASAREIKNAYRELAFKHHPDRNRDNPDAVNAMKAVNEAYAVLSNPQKRQTYDALQNQYGASAHQQFRQSYDERDIFAGSDVFRVFEELTRLHGFRHYDEIFREFYGNGFRRYEVKRPGMTLRGFVFTGGGPLRRGQVPKGLRPPHFRRGWGRLAQGLLERLTGFAVPRSGADVEERIRLSTEMARQGGPYAYFHRRQGKKLVVKIPAGVRAGQRIRLAGLGEAGHAGGSAGDLYLRVVIVRPWLQGLISRWRAWWHGRGGMPRT
jgi:curved DNA-binding protein CbpA